MLTARCTPFGPWQHAVATFLKTSQTLSDLFGLTLSQGALMNRLRCAEGCFCARRDVAVLALREAEVVACDENGVRIEGANAYHWVFHSAAAVVHTASPTWDSIAVHDMMDGHRPAV